MARQSGRAREVLVLTVTEAREVLGTDCPMTDNEIEAMLAQFLQIALISLDTTEREAVRACTTEEQST